MFGLSDVTATAVERELASVKPRGFIVGLKVERHHLRPHGPRSGGVVVIRRAVGSSCNTCSIVFTNSRLFDHRVAGTPLYSFDLG